MRKQLNPKLVVAWVLVAVTAAVLEVIGLLSDTDDLWPLTQIVVQYLPATIVLAALTWLLNHFILSYRDARKLDDED